MYEWNEIAIGSSRGLRGGVWGDNSDDMLASNRYSSIPTYENHRTYGFRVASSQAVPAPSSLTCLLGIGVMVAGMEWWKPNHL